MKKIIVFLILAFSVLGLAGCAPGQNTPGATIVGAAGGGLLGGAIFQGNPVGIAAGALIGGGIGYVVGRQMDEQDRINMMNAAENTPINEEATWTNTRTGATYIVRPVRVYHRRGRYCREFQTSVRIGGHWRRAYGTACRMPDGSWKIVK